MKLILQYNDIGTKAALVTLTQSRLVDMAKFIDTIHPCELTLDYSASKLKGVLCFENTMLIFTCTPKMLGNIRQDEIHISVSKKSVILNGIKLKPCVVRLNTVATVIGSYIQKARKERQWTNQTTSDLTQTVR